MVNVRSRMCRTDGCGKYALFGVAGTKTAEYCTQHAPDGMVNVRARMCSTEGCGKRASFGVAGTKRPEYCTQHAPDGMVHVRKIKYITEGCGKEPSFGFVGTKTTEYCEQHNWPRCGVEGCRRRGVGPNHSGKGTIGDASTSGSKHETVHSPPTQASPLSDVSCISCKQVQHPHNVPTALKRAVILESAAGAVTMPEIEGQKSPVKRDPSVKTEVHVSL
ncbi:unnamed protein product [Ascophyllum nodosum]